MRNALLGLSMVLAGFLLQLHGEPVRATTHPAQVAAVDVVQGLAEAGIRVRPSQVAFLADIPSTVAHARLEFLRLQRFGSTTRALMRCADPGACIPFYVVVSGMADAQTNQPALPRPAESAPAAKPVPEPKPAQGVPGKREAVAGVEREPIVLKQGSAATLQIAADHMLITVPVIALQNGHRGERVRVTSVDHTKIFVAEVVSANSVRTGLRE